MYSFIFVCFTLVHGQSRQVNKDTSVQLLSELPLDKLLRLQNSLKYYNSNYFNATIEHPVHRGPDGANAMALHGARPTKRIGYDDDIKKTDHGNSKISSIFSLSVTTLAFLAFGGYLLCLIVQAVKYKSNMDTSATQPTFLVSAGIKKRPQGQLTASYGRKKRDAGGGTMFEDGTDLGPSPDELYDALLGLCEGYAKWDRLNLEHFAHQDI